MARLSQHVTLNNIIDLATETVEILFVKGKAVSIVANYYPFLGSFQNYDSFARLKAHSCYPGSAWIGAFSNFFHFCFTKGNTQVL